MDLSQVLSVINGSRANSQGLQGQAESAFGKASSAVSAGGEAQQELLKQKAVVDAQRSLGEFQAQENARAAATALGTNMDVEGQVISQIGQTMRQSAVDMIQAQKEVAKLESNNSMFSNPIGFLQDLFFGDEIRGKAEATTKVFTSAAAALQGLNAATQQTAVTQNAISKVRTDASLLAEQKMAAAEAAKAAATTRERLAGIDLDRINTISTLDARQTQLAIQAYSIKSQADEASRAESRRKAQEAEAKKDIESMISSYNTAAQALGKRPVNSVDEFKELMSVERMLPQNRRSMAFMLEKGYELQQTGKMTYGANPIEAMQTVEITKVPVNEPQKLLIQKINRARAGANNVDKVFQDMVAQLGKTEAQLDTATKITLREQAAKMATNAKERPQLEMNAISGALQNWMSQVSVGDTSNPYAPPPINSVAGAPYLENNRFLAQYVAPTVATATAPVEFNPDNLLKYATDAINSGISTTEVAEGWAWLGRQAVLTNNSVYDYSKFGMPEQRYLPMATTIPTSSMFGNGEVVQVVDQTDPAAILQAITKALTANERTVPEILTTGFETLWGKPPSLGR